MHGFWYKYIKLKYEGKTKLCWMNTDSFIVYIKADYIFKDIPEDIEMGSDPWNYYLDRSLPKRKNKKPSG